MSKGLEAFGFDDCAARGLEPFDAFVSHPLFDFALLAVLVVAFAGGGFFTNRRSYCLNYCSSSYNSIHYMAKENK